MLISRFIIVVTKLKKLKIGTKKLFNKYFFIITKYKNNLKIFDLLDRVYTRGLKLKYIRRPNGRTRRQKRLRVPKKDEKVI